jgi:hypothetical protein
VDVYKHLPQAELSRKALSSVNSSASSSSPSSSSSTSAPTTLSTPLTHFDSSGWLTPVVDPYNYPAEGSRSPESEAFIIEMTAAYQDWVALGSKGANGALGIRSASSAALVWAMIVGSGAAAWLLM